MRSYLVGGAVRDGLLNIDVYDRDWVVVGSTPEEMVGLGYSQVGKDFPVFLHPKTKEEYALARTERKSGLGYHGFEVFSDASVTLEEDLKRRDLTINAMALDSKGLVVDPYGGQDDLRDRVLRHVSDAFVEDPLRVLRVARFAAKLADFGFTVAEETSALMAAMVGSGELLNLTPERVWQEVGKALQCQKPSVFFDVLDRVGAVKVLFPELYALHGVQQPVKHHPEGDVWIHTMMVLDTAALLSDEVDVRFAALVHDLGKGLTQKSLWPKHHGHESAGVPLVSSLCKRYRIPKKTQNLAKKVTELHGLIHRGLDSDGTPFLKPKTYLSVFKASNAIKNPEVFSKLLLCCLADARGRLNFENVEYPQFRFWQQLLVYVSVVDVADIVKMGYQGVEIANQIDEARLGLIQTFIEGDKSYM